MVDDVCSVPNCEVDNCFATACTLCNDGFYLEEFKCYQCPDNCLGCLSGDHCEKCPDGRYGSVCHLQCAEGCKGSLCEKDTGFCTEGCQKGFTMTAGTCTNCPKNCINCLSMDICSSCKLGFWGDACQFDCIGCSTDGCGVDLNCTDGCRDGYFAETLKQVNDAFECLVCPERCETCRNSENCLLCKPGFWGDHCSQTCNNNCKISKCYKSDGQCIEGCQTGFFGTMCSQKCSSRCETCDDGERCKVCAPGRYGVMCEHKCSSNCFRYKCHRENGTCMFGCSVGFSGETCDKGINFVFDLRCAINRRSQSLQ